MSTTRLALLLAAAVLTTASVATLVAGLLTGLITPGTAVTGLMILTSALWVSWGLSGKIEKIGQIREHRSVEGTLRRLDTERSSRF